MTIEEAVKVLCTHPKRNVRMDTVLAVDPVELKILRMRAKLSQAEMAENTLAMSIHVSWLETGRGNLVPATIVLSLLEKYLELARRQSDYSGTPALRQEGSVPRVEGPGS